METTYEFPLNNEQINVGMLSDNTWRGFCTAKEMILKKRDLWNGRNICNISIIYSNYLRRAYGLIAK